MGVTHANEHGLPGDASSSPGAQDGMTLKGAGLRQEEQTEGRLELPGGVRPPAAVAGAA